MAEAADFVTLTYGDSGDGRQDIDLFLPAAKKEVKPPLLVFIHG